MSGHSVGSVWPLSDCMPLLGWISNWSQGQTGARHGGYICTIIYCNLQYTESQGNSFHTAEGLRSWFRAKQIISRLVLMAQVIGKLHLVIDNDDYRIPNTVDLPWYFVYPTTSFYQRGVCPVTAYHGMCNGWKQTENILVNVNLCLST